MRTPRQALALLALVAFTPGCGRLVRLIGHPRVTRVRPRVEGIDLQGVDLAFDVHVRNPYPFALRTPRCRYGLDVQGGELAAGEATSRTTLPARSTTPFSLPLRLRYADVWHRVRALSGASKVDYRLRGTVIFSPFGQPVEIPLSHAASFPILRAPRIVDIEAHFSDISLSKARVRVEARIENPNIFAVNIRDAGYALVVGDTPVASLILSTDGTLGPGEVGTLTLTGELRAQEPLRRLVAGERLGKARLAPSGFIKTPYGTVKLRKKRRKPEAKDE